MDRMIHTALNALRVMRDTQVNQAQNLANQNVPGFRRDLTDNTNTKFLDVMNGLQTRAFQMEGEGGAFAVQAGFMDRTGEELDVAIGDQGYFFIQPENGDVALSRRGDMRRQPDGTLVNGAGDVMLDAGLQPIVVPPYQSIRITELGEIHIEPQGGAPGETVVAGVLGTVVPDPEVQLRKGLDGEIRQVDGGVPNPNQGAEVIQFTLEGSNVNPVEELLTSIEIQRNFEIGLRMVMSAKELDEGSATLMRAPE